jgi:hypothetical protein
MAQLQIIRDTLLCLAKSYCLLRPLWALSIWLWQFARHCSVVECLYLPAKKGNKILFFMEKWCQVEKLKYSRPYEEKELVSGHVRCPFTSRRSAAPFHSQSVYFGLKLSRSAIATSSRDWSCCNGRWVSEAPSRPSYITFVQRYK